MSSWLEAIRSQFPGGQTLRYLIAGVWNTLFGYGCFAVITYLLTGILPAAYMFASVASTVISITFSYATYKLFVFKTQGNCVREYLRCCAVYGTTSLVSLALLPILVTLGNWLLPSPFWSPYIAGALLIGAGVAMSFLGHKNYTFAANSTVTNAVGGNEQTSSPTLGSA